MPHPKVVLYFDKKSGDLKDRIPTKFEQMYYQQQIKTTFVRQCLQLLNKNYIQKDLQILDQDGDARTATQCDRTCEPFFRLLLNLTHSSANPIIPFHPHSNNLQQKNHTNTVSIKYPIHSFSSTYTINKFATSSTCVEHTSIEIYIIY